ncbi:SH3 domain-containing protein [Streptomyces justiciae]|uniref:SH3b domain-containing protein n=1 Tax=Streptomyces justiciae TaxID=2780140 RepID=A0ABU3M0Y7_9ACTN|nr:hypothetical protein [Streptomyces justiciae]MBE8470953.1 hypothetical protein [Streptomyces justiciae]MCW8383507.1 hypothetical protein [Streptomyces justiciae]MDT7845172.1 hypothetical protein [Streptomyces justiciae]
MTSLKRGSLLLAGTAAAFLTVLGTASQAAAAGYPVVGTSDVNARSGPGTSYQIIKTYKPGTTLTLVCQTPGETITGPLGTSNIWDKTADGVYVSDTYVKTGSDGYVTRRC